MYVCFLSTDRYYVMIKDRFLFYLPISIKTSEEDYWYEEECLGIKLGVSKCFCY